MGIYSRYIRPGRIGEMSVIGFVLLMASIILAATSQPARSGVRCSPSTASS